jgi:hypothetical protein
VRGCGRAGERGAGWGGDLSGMQQRGQQQFVTPPLVLCGFVFATSSREWAGDEGRKGRGHARDSAGCGARSVAPGGGRDHRGGAGRGEE